MKIETGFHGADLFNEEGYDVAKSAALYADMLEKEIKRAFPGAEVEVSYDTNAGGVLPYALQTRIDGMDVSVADETTMNNLMEIDDIHTRVYQEFTWAVEEAGEED